MSLSLFTVAWGLSGPALPPEGEAPLHRPPSSEAAEPEVAMPLGEGPKVEPERSLDPKKSLMVRADVMLGPVWRIRPVDTMLSTSVEVGQMHGFSGSFHTAMIVVSDRDSLQAFDVPIGVGALYRGRLKNRALYGSVGLSLGVLVHRAKFDGELIHRVDPDIVLPIRGAWTIGKIGISLALVQGYSVRNRSYEQRGTTIWERHAYRIGLMLGMHLDIVPKRWRRY